MLHKKMNAKLLATLFVSSAILFAGCHRFHRFHCKVSHEKIAQWMVKKVSRDLDLTDEQKKELNRIKDEILVKHLELKKEHQEILTAVLQQVKNDSVNEAVLNDLFAGKEPKIKEMRTFLIAKFAEFHRILTPSQRDKLAKHINEFHEKCNQE
jgi:protein CpxP